MDENQNSAWSLLVPCVIGVFLKGTIIWALIVARKADFVANKQQRCRLACTAMQSDQHIIIQSLESMID